MLKRAISSGFLAERRRQVDYHQEHAWADWVSKRKCCTFRDGCQEAARGDIKTRRVYAVGGDVLSVHEGEGCDQVCSGYEEDGLCRGGCYAV